MSLLMSPVIAAARNLLWSDSIIGDPISMLSRRWLLEPLQYPNNVTILPILVIDEPL
jgi:hypothetical protein